jgi:hypothetical protein
LDDSVERDVLAHDDLPHSGSAPRWSSGNPTLTARPATPPCLAEQPVSFAGPPGVILDGFREVFEDDHGLLLLLATIVIVPSRSTMKNAPPSSASVHQGRGSSTADATRPADADDSIVNLQGRSQQPRHDPPLDRSGGR